MSLAGAYATIAGAAQYTSSNFIVRDPVLGAIGGYGAGSSFQLFSSGDLVFNGRGSSSGFVGRFGFLNFPYVTTPTLTATAGAQQVALSWSASSAGLGFTISGYEYGIASVSGGPYTYSNVGNVSSTTASALTAGTTYYFVVRTLDAFGAPIATSNEVSAIPSGAVTPPADTTSGSVPVVMGVQFYGHAYPFAVVSILKNAVARAVTTANASGSFSATLQEPYDRALVYTLYADDSDGERSLLINYPIVVDEGLSAKISGVRFAPTIHTDYLTVKKGESISISGFALPNTTIEFILTGAGKQTLTTVSSGSGRYTLSVATDDLAFGEYEIKARYPDDPRMSLTVQFGVAGATVLKTVTDESIPGDCNSDGQITVKDFSVLAYWYERSNPPACIDVNHDGIVTVVDFSILAYYWSG